MAEYGTLVEFQIDQPLQPVRAAFVFLLSLCVSCLCIHYGFTRHFWHPEIRGITDRLQEYDRVSSNIDTVAIGSSHVYYGFDSRSFDEFNKGRSDFQSYNLGIEGLTIAERHAIVDHLCDNPPSSLSMILLEPENRMINAPDQIMSRRCRYFLSLTNLRALAETKLFSRRDLRKRLLGATPAFAGALLSSINLGVLSDTLLPPVLSTQLHIHNQNDIWSGEKRFVGVSEKIQKALDQVRIKPLPTHRILVEPEFVEIRRDIEKLQSHGFQVVLIFPPATRGFEEDLAIRKFAKEHGTTRIISAMPDSEYWDEFDSPDVWYDTTHLNERGARVFSQILAKENHRSETLDSVDVKANVIH